MVRANPLRLGSTTPADEIIVANKMERLKSRIG